jgi:2-methylaconitate cis-trans-isomerase PrpF
MTLLPDTYGRQLDGLGAGISSLSKICIVGPSTHPAADVDYTFAAVDISSSEVDFSGNCGNMSSAIGPFAYNHGLVARANQPSMTVRIHNTNTYKIIHSTFQVTDDRREAATSGGCTIAGVSGTGAGIKLSFLDPAGSKTGASLPTGNAVDDLLGIEVSLVDAANPCIFVRAGDVGALGAELPDQISDDTLLLRRLEELRRLGAHAMDMCAQPQDAPRTVPKIAMVSRPTKHSVLGGDDLAQNEVDIVVRVISDRQPHRAIPLTAALCTAVAATIRGSIVDAMLGRKRVKDGLLTIGHPSGGIQVGVEMDGSGHVQAVNVVRTARPLMEGVVYY